MTKHDDEHGRKEEASRAAANRMLVRVGVAVERLDTWAAEAPDGEHFVTAITFKIRYDDVGDVLAVLKADAVEGGEIAFHAADTVSSALVGLVNRLDNGSLKWREDKPYGSHKDNGGPGTPSA